ncbi:MAG: peptidoglycan-binding protein, partial [Firmicutes bacterium]|nr:peptidoglycan-binding protein [Bacillota bacterium]
PLARGAYGSDVQLLQEMLAELGYEPSLDGYYDEATALALSIFQSEAGLEASGKFDDLTWVQLREAFEDIACERDPQLIRAVELMEQPGIWPEPEVKGS